MARLVKCIKGFSVQLIDEHDNQVENEEMHIEEGSLWEESATSGLTEVHLIRVNGSGNLHVFEEDLNTEYLVVVK